MKFVIILKKLVRWLKGYVGFLCPLYLLISSLCSENTSTINSFTKDELGGLPFGVGRKESVEEERGIYGMSVRGFSKRHHHSKWNSYQPHTTQKERDGVWKCFSLQKIGCTSWKLGRTSINACKKENSLSP